MPVFDTPTPISATVGIPNGRLHLVASGRSDTTVKVRPSDPAAEGDVAAAAATRWSTAVDA